MRARNQEGSVVLDKRIRTWNFFWWEKGKRKCKALGRYPTKADAWKAAKQLRDSLETQVQARNAGVPIEARWWNNIRQKRCLNGKTHVGHINRGFAFTSCQNGDRT
jgi:hypothetical protein